MSAGDEKNNNNSVTEFETENIKIETEQPTEQSMETSATNKADQEELLSKPVSSDTNRSQTCTDRSELEYLESERECLKLTDKKGCEEKANCLVGEEHQERKWECVNELQSSQLPVTNYEEKYEDLTEEYETKGVVIKVEPLPLVIRKSVFRMFFPNFKLYQDGQILLLPTNNYTSCGYIVFIDENEAKKVIEYWKKYKQQNNVVKIRIASEDEYIMALQQTIAFSPQATQLFGWNNSSNAWNANLQFNNSGTTNSNIVVDKQNCFLIRLRGFPFDATERNIKAFLKKVDNVERIEMALFNDGTFSGEAFIEVSNIKGVEEAFKLDKKIMGRRYIEVMPSSLEEKQITINYLKRRSSTLQRLNRSNQPTSLTVSNAAAAWHGNSNVSTTTNSNSSFAVTSTSNRNRSNSFSNTNFNQENRNTTVERINYSNNVALPGAYSLPRSQTFPVQQQTNLSFSQFENQQFPFCQWLPYQNYNYSNNNNYAYTYNQGQQPMLVRQQWIAPVSNITSTQGEMRYNSQPSALTHFSAVANSYAPTLYPALGAHTYVYNNTVTSYNNVFTQTQRRRPLLRPWNECSEYIVRVRGVPFTATWDTIAAHFYDVEIYSNGIHRVIDSEGNWHNEVFIEVPSSNYVELALRHDGEYMGQYRLNVFRSSRDEMKDEGLTLFNVFQTTAEPN